MKKYYFLILLFLLLSCYNGFIIKNKGIKESWVEYKKESQYHSETTLEYEYDFIEGEYRWHQVTHSVFDGYKYYRVEYPDQYFFGVNLVEINKENRVKKINEKKVKMIYITKNIYDSLRLENYFRKSTVKFSYNYLNANIIEITEKEYIKGLNIDW